jgi:pimeloyl-ACP methyl ester carboxylesterase
VVRALFAAVRLLAWLLVGTAKVAAFVLRSPRDSLRAWRAARQAYASYRGEVQRPLTRLGEGLYRLEADEAASECDKDVRPTVIYFTGSGETPHAPTTAYVRLLGSTPARTAGHFVVEAPSGRGAYYGSGAFSARIWERVRPLVEAAEGPFVLVGFSRGALAALDVATRLSDEHSKVVSVLAFSPPLETKSELPRSIVGIAGFEPVLERMEAALPALPAWARRLAGQVVERVHLWFSGLVHIELGMLDPYDLTLTLHDMRLGGALATSIRVVREFRLLVEAKSRELELFARQVAGSAARSARFFAALVWGQNDPWAPAEASRARMEAAIARENSPPDRVVLHMLTGRGHALFRESESPIEALTSLLESTYGEALARVKVEHARREKAEAFERTLRESKRPTA